MMSDKKRFLSRLRRISVIIITVLFLFSALSMVVTKFVYDGIFSRYDTPADIPKELSATVDSRTVHTLFSGENQLTGYFYPNDKPEKAYGLIVLVPGFHAGGDNYLWQIRSLLDYGWSVFTFDPTGSLRSQGKNQVGFSQLIPDLEAVLKYIEKNQNFGYNDIVLMGHSRGGYAACCVLARETDIAAVVSVSGVNSAMEGIMQMSAGAVGPVAYGNYGFLWLYQAILFGEDTLELDAAEAISESDVPVLVIHGTRDDQIPMDRSSIISHKEEISSGNVEYLTCPAGHTDLLYDGDGTASDTLMQDIHEFLIRCLEQP